MITAINTDIYGKMRVWENTRRFEIEERKRIFEGRKVEPDTWDLYERNEEETLDRHRTQMLIFIDRNKKVQKELSDMGIDVEYIVTSYYNELRKGFWLHDFYFEEVKIENGGYVYDIHENELRNVISNYQTVEEAIKSILPLYNFIYDDDHAPTLESVIESKWDIIK